MNVHKPHIARQAKRAKHQPRSLQTLVATLWDALDEAAAIMQRAEGDEVKLRAVHAVSQVGGQIGRLLEIGELEARLSAVEQAQRGAAA
jgi:hypothetical protein